MQDSKSHKYVCDLNDSDNDIQPLYNCTLKTNEEMDNIKIDNIEFENEDVEIVSISPLGLKYMDNVQNVGNVDNFNKKLFLMDNSTKSIDNKKHELNITGIIDDKNFNINNYKNKIFNLSLNSEYVQEKIVNIKCAFEGQINNKYTKIKCSSNNEVRANLTGAFADLGKENLIINYLNNSKDEINFINNDNINGTKIRPAEKKRKGLSKGAIIAICVLCVVTLIIIIIVSIILYKNENKFLEQEDQNATELKDINEASSTNL